KVTWLANVVPRPATYVPLAEPSSHQMTCSPTQPDLVSDTLRLPLRAVVASSSAIRSSRSAQQLPPRSAADALPAVSPPISRPAATRAPRLNFFIDLLPSASDGDATHKCRLLPT